MASCKAAALRAAAHRDAPQAAEGEAGECAELAQGQQVGISQGCGASQVQVL